MSFYLGIYSSYDLKINDKKLDEFNQWSSQLNSVNNLTISFDRRTKSIKLNMSHDHISVSEEVLLDVFRKLSQVINNGYVMFYTVDSLGDKEWYKVMSGKVFKMSQQLVVADLKELLLDKIADLQDSFLERNSRVFDELINNMVDLIEYGIN